MEMQADDEAFHWLSRYLINSLLGFANIENQLPN